MEWWIPVGIRDLVREYRASGGGAAVLVEFPSAGHGSDLVFWNPYSQVFLHYMERFPGDPCPAIRREA
ncbi:MAG: hypothetical protein M0C28_30495 [Candidatus Moduliflexus flocculans]|nr:hypothetical protein [Candidatus Moduliflexus flocculans]